MRVRAALGVLTLALPTVARAQVRPRASEARTTAAPQDSTARDTTVRWSEPDSVMRALLQKPGYSVTRYEGDVVVFDATSNAFTIATAAAIAAADTLARRAQVEREGQRVVTDSSIIYNDKTRTVNVNGRFEITPGGGQAPIAGFGNATYNLTERSGRLTNATVTTEETGQRWFIRSEIGKILGDSTRGVASRFYGVGGTLTSCDDSIPDYHFELREIKRTTKTLVARPAVLYIRDIPVMWLPFVFQDIRPGRRSGVLPPRIGASDIVRNNPGYRRHIENIGYYWALNDYMDATGWVDWRSAAGADSLDPGWYKFNGEMKYNWMSRFLSGRFASSYQRQRNGLENLAVSWDHQQKLGPNRSFTMAANYVTSTRLQRQNTYNPYQATATIASRLNYSDKIGPASLQFGASRTQYPGRDQVDQTLPTFSLTAGSIAIAPFLVWTPNFSFSEHALLHSDQPSQFNTRYISDGNGNVVRVDTLKKNSFDRAMSFDTPLRIFGFDLRNSIQVHDLLNDFPTQEDVYPHADSALKESRIFLKTYKTEVNWNPVFTLPTPGFLQNRFKLTPSISLSNVDAGPYWVRSELSNGRFVQQTKRLAYGLSASPAIYGVFPGFGPFQRFRHAITPTISYSFAPPAKVSDAYLEARGFRRQGYLGSLRQNAVSLGLSQNIEAKLRTPLDTSGSANAQKIKVLGIGFSALSYDFERARVTGRKLAGLTSENLSTQITSDLIPGFNVSVDHSLFRGSTQSDSARFEPFLTRIASSFHLSKGENPFTVIARLLGKAVPDQSPAPQVSLQASAQEAAMARQVGSLPVAGQASRGTQFVVPPTRGWEASLNFSTSRTRRPTGANVIEFDPKIRCEQFKLINPLAYQQCLSAPSNDTPIPTTTAGAPMVHMPAQTNLSGDLRFELTQKWSAAWNTSYDFERHQFASHIVSLQRDLHDWRANFNFTHSPNGNFAFSFFISLKPEPELKFDYSRATFRSR